MEVTTEGKQHTSTAHTSVWPYTCRPGARAPSKLVRSQVITAMALMSLEGG